MTRHASVLNLVVIAMWLQAVGQHDLVWTQTSYSRGSFAILCASDATLDRSRRCESSLSVNIGPQVANKCPQVSFKETLLTLYYTSQPEHFHCSKHIWSVLLLLHMNVHNTNDWVHRSNMIRAVQYWHSCSIKRVSGQLVHFKTCPEIDLRTAQMNASWFSIANNHKSPRWFERGNPLSPGHFSRAATRHVFTVSISVNGAWLGFSCWRQV